MIIAVALVTDPWLVMPILAIGMGFIALAIISPAPDHVRLR